MDLLVITSPVLLLLILWWCVGTRERRTATRSARLQSIAWQRRSAEAVAECSSPEELRALFDMQLASLPVDTLAPYAENADSIVEHTRAALDEHAELLDDPAWDPTPARMLDISIYFAITDRHRHVVERLSQVGIDRTVALRNISQLVAGLPLSARRARINRANIEYRSIANRLARLASRFDLQSETARVIEFGDGLQAATGGLEDRSAMESHLQIQQVENDLLSLHLFLSQIVSDTIRIDGARNELGELVASARARLTRLRIPVAPFERELDVLAVDIDRLVDTRHQRVHECVEAVERLAKKIANVVAVAERATQRRSYSGEASFASFVVADTGSCDGGGCGGCGSA